MRPVPPPVRGPGSPCSPRRRWRGSARTWRRWRSRWVARLGPGWRGRHRGPAWAWAAGQVPDPTAPPTRAPTGVGRSMLVDPMGTVRADAGPFAGITVAELDSALTAQVRAVLPCLEHRRDDVFGPAAAAGRLA